MRTNKHWTHFFWRHVIKQEGDSCWEWKGGTHKFGYGMFGGAKPWCKSYVELGEVYAHRISWILHFGPIPPDKWVLHRCDNPPCTNPKHLFLGDNDSNSTDRESKGRGNHDRVNGEGNPGAKLSSTEVRAIRLLYCQGYRQGELAAVFGVTQSIISDIVNRRSWGHL